MLYINYIDIHILFSCAVKYITDSSLFRFPVVSVGIIRWVECTVTESSYFKLCTEHCPVHLALLDEVVVCHSLLHPKILQLLVHLFESKQDELEILVQVRYFEYSKRKYKINFQ